MSVFIYSVMKALPEVWLVDQPQELRVRAQPVMRLRDEESIEASQVGMMYACTYVCTTVHGITNSPQYITGKQTGRSY